MKRYLFLLSLILVLLLGLTGWGALSLFAQPVLQPASAAVSQVAPTALPASGTASGTSPLAPNRIYAQVSPSVVMIEVVEAGSSPFVRRGRGFRRVPQGQPLWDGQGSGFVWDTQGDIVTNNHVVAGASRIAVVFADGTSVPAQVVGTDPYSDLAVVRVSAPAAELHPVKLADSTQLQVGQTAIAIGSPLGQMNKMTTGSVTGLEQTLPVSDGNFWGSTYVIPDLIQTDAPINPGNSGGVLLDDQGRVIGVTNAIESPTGRWAGIGFAVPSDTVAKVVPALIQSGHYTHPWLGISGASLDPRTARQLGLSSDQQGAVVMDVVPGGPASDAGLTGGDVIVAIGGQPVQSFDEVVSYLARNTSVGQTIRLTVLRNGQDQTLSVTLAARPNA
jgi:S1-C subfamily serine protease